MATNQFLTFTEFLAQIKLEAMINDTSYDLLIQQLTNECLTEIISNTRDLRDFALNVEFPILTVATTPILDYYWANIDQVYYQYVPADTTPQQRYALTEQKGIIEPLLVRFLDKPNSYSLINTTAASNSPSYLMTFYPKSRARTTDLIEIVGTGFKHIVNAADLMPYNSVYPALTRSILQRLQITRNKGLESVKQWDGPIQRALTGASQGTKEVGNSENSPT